MPGAGSPRMAPLGVTPGGLVSPRGPQFGMQPGVGTPSNWGGVSNPNTPRVAPEPLRCTRDRTRTAQHVCGGVLRRARIHGSQTFVSLKSRLESDNIKKHNEPLRCAPNRARTAQRGVSYERGASYERGTPQRVTSRQLVVDPRPHVMGVGVDANRAPFGTDVDSTRQGFCLPRKCRGTSL